MELTTSLLIESWILYALGLVIMASRMVSRKIKLGKWKNLMIDDYLMMFALVNFTGVVVSINEVAKSGSNYMPAEEAAALSPEGVAKAVYGSIMTFVLEIFTLTGTWTVKACLLILYARLTHNTMTRQHMLVKVAAVYCALTYTIVTFMFVFYWCSPNTTEYWAVPVRITQCATYYHHMIFATACNISSDILLFFIPIPIIIRSQLPLRRKVILCCILGLGVFNILAAILNRYYNFSTPNSYVFLFWYVAEVGISMIVGNLPLCWPILRLVLGSRVAPKTPSYHGDTIGSSRKKQRIMNPLSTMGTLASRWDKLDEAEADVGCARRAAEQGSQIELVMQENKEDERGRASGLDKLPTVVSVHQHERQSNSGGSVNGSSDGRATVVKTV